MEFDTRARTDYILGQPPRMAPLRQDEVGAEAMELIYRLREQTSVPRDAPLHPIFGTLFRNPDLFPLYFEMGMKFLKGSALSPRDRELVILRTGWLCGAPYEWGEHVERGKQIGLTGEEIERITQGSGAPGWNEDDRALLRAAEELHDDAMISDATWDVLSRRLDDKQLIELPMIVGHYHKVAFVQNSLRLKPRPENLGLSAR